MPKLRKRALLEVAALLVADDRDRPAAERADARDHGVIVRACAVAVQLDPVVDRVGPRSPACRAGRRRARELDGIPDVRLGRAHGRGWQPQPAERRGQVGCSRRPSVRVRRRRAGVERRNRSTRATMPGGGAHLAVDLHRHERATGAQPERCVPRLVAGVRPLITASIRPCSRLDSARPKSSGERLARRLLHARAGRRTRAARQAPRRRSRRARRTDAITPPVVGWASTETNGHAGLTQQVDGAHGLRHLHERQHVLLHARAAQAATETSGMPRSARHVGCAREDLADDAAHRAAHEREVHRAEHARHALDGGGAGDHARRPGPWRPRPRSGAPCRAQIGEGEADRRSASPRDRAEAAGIGELLDALLGADREVVAAHRAVHAAAGRATRPSR